VNLSPVPDSNPATVDGVLDAVRTVQAGLDAMRDEIAKSVMGHTRVVDQVLCCLLADGHALLEGVPGTGKTLLVRTIAAVTGLDMGRVQFTPDLLPADITGTTVMAESADGRRATVFRPGPIFSLLEAMQERRVTVAGTTHQLPPPFIVLATQNPIEQEGTHRLPEAQIDRFTMKILMPPPDAAVLERIIGATTELDLYVPQQRIDAGFLKSATQLSQRIVLAPHVNDWIAALVIGTGDPSVGGDVPSLLASPCSPRAAISIRRCAQVAALSAGRVAVSCGDVRVVLHGCMRHRMTPSPVGRGRDMQADEIVDQLLCTVASPAEEAIR
jgi:MoxR-like ATPase